MFMPPWPKNHKASSKIMEILKFLGNPHLSLPPVIHVAGTNGKGSTIAFIREIAIKHKKKICSFTSPHLLEFNENFIVNNQRISDAEILENINFIRNKISDRIDIGFFEFQTALAFYLFSKANADLCIIECGMGAKNDPTNIIPSPHLAILTSISLDHKKFLGDNIADITLNKCHLIKKSPVITAYQTSEAMFIIDKFCKLQNVSLLAPQRNYDFFIENNQFNYVDIDKEEIIPFAKPSLVGEHQYENLATAITAIKTQKIFNSDNSCINEALINTKWKGRIEKIHYKNLEIFFDGAHNQSGAESLSKWLKKQELKNTIIIYGRTAGAEHDEFLKYFYNLEKTKIFFVRVLHEQNPETSHSFQKFQEANPKYKNILIADSLADVFNQNNLVNQTNNRILICGSLFLYRDLHKMMRG
jgi:dihydrofolate synthase/folylpolyglutamate synthase